MLSKIVSMQDSLPRAEHSVAAYILAHPAKILSMTLAQLSLQTAVSEPSIIRFCRRLGCRGYSDFKLTLAGDIGNENTHAHADVNITNTPQEIIQIIFNRSIQELNRVKNYLDSAALELAVNVLSQCLRIEFYGIGASGHVVRDAQNKFFRLGKPCNAYADLPTIKQAAAISDESYCIVMVSKTGSSNAFCEVCKNAQSNGAVVIALSAPDSKLSQQADIPIALEISEDTNAYTPMSSRLAQLVILDILQVSLALEMAEIANDKLIKTKQALR